MTTKAMKTYRAKRKEQGRVRVEVWVHQDDKFTLKSFAAEIWDKRKALEQEMQGMDKLFAKEAIKDD